MDNFIAEFDKEAKSLREEVQDLMWHFRGSLSRSEAWSISRIEREEYFSCIEDRWKIVKETKLPLL